MLLHMDNSKPSDPIKKVNIEEMRISNFLNIHFFNWVNCQSIRLELKPIIDLLQNFIFPNIAVEN
jgi:hypothetical protein